MLRKPRRAAAALGASLAVMLGTSGVTPVHAADPVVFREGTTMQASGMNILYAGSYAQTMAYEPLVQVQTDNPNYEFPEFAESWSANADYSVWTFKVRPNQKWSDGQPATAQDVVFTYTYIKNSVGTKWPIPTFANLTLIKDVKALDDLTVQFTLTGPSDILTNVLNNQQIVPEHVWSKLTYEQASTYNDLPNVGTGPFVATEWKQGQYIKSEKNPYFRGPGPFVDQVLTISYATSDAVAQALRAGEIDVAFDLPLSLYDQLAVDPNLHLINAVGGYQVLSFNMMSGKGAGSTPALLDQKFRDALGYAIDKQALVDKVAAGHGAAMESMVTSFAKDYQQPMTGIERTYDPAKANQLLDAAGYTKGADGIRVDQNGKPLVLTMLVQAGSPMETVSQYLVGWFAAVGVKVVPTIADYSAWAQKVNNLPKDGAGGWDITIYQGYQNPWPGSFLTTWITSMLGQYNASHWTSPEFDSLVAQILATADAAKIKDLANQAVRMLYTVSPDINLYENFGLQAYRTDKFEGWTGCGSPTGAVVYCMAPDTSYTIRPIGTGPSAAPSAGTSAIPTESAPATASPAPSPAPGSAGGGSSSTGLAVLGGVIVVVIVAGALVLRRRRGTPGRS